MFATRSGEYTPLMKERASITSAVPARAIRTRRDSASIRPSASTNPSCCIVNQTNSRFANPIAVIPVAARMTSTATAAAPSIARVRNGAAS